MIRETNQHIRFAEKCCGVIQSPAMYGKALSALAVMIILAIGVGFFVWNAQGGTKTYTNSVHGFAIQYPADLDVREYGDENAIIGEIAPESVAARAEIRVMQVQGEPGQSLEDAVAELLKNLCAADGPTASFSCVRVESSRPFVSEQGREATVIVLRGELKNLETGSTTPYAMGPYYAFLVGTSATISKVAVIHPPLNTMLQDADLALIEAIAASFQVQ
jgi:hypothetical protein